MASRIPESLSSIGRDISRTIERALSAKDDYVVAVKVSHEAQDSLEQLVQAGVFRSRADAAAFLIDEGASPVDAYVGRVVVVAPQECEKPALTLRQVRAPPTLTGVVDSRAIWRL